MNVDLDTLARYPTQSEDWMVTILIGGIAVLLSFLVVPWFLLWGYLVRDLRAGMDDATRPPVFDEWGSLLREGLVAGIIGFVYQLVPIAVFVVTVGGSILALVRGSGGVGLVGILGGLFVSWLLAIVFGYVGVAGIANYARERRFAAGFSPGPVLSIATSREYFVAWLYVIALNVVAGVVVGVLNVVPVLGGIAGAFVAFYALVIAGWLWGNGVAAATEGAARSSAGEVGAPQ